MERAPPGFPTGIGPSTITVPSQITYAGPAPYLVAGASQINFQVLYALAPLTISAGGVGSTFMVYVAE